MKYSRSATTPASGDIILTKNIDVHQCAKLCNVPNYSREQAVKRIMRYIIGITINYSANKKATQRIVFIPDKARSIY